MVQTPPEKSISQTTMPVRRVLVDCAVLSLHDSCIFYPCCKACFSKIDLQQQDTARVRCIQCGTSSVRGQVDYRYRLALRVAHDRHIFGVTVFGSCLNPLFGVHASGLQRLLEASEEPTGTQTRFSLLIQAVNDCFIGRHFIFGIKVPHADKGPLFGGQQGGPTLIGSSSKEHVHFIASQIIPPKATAQGGSSVVSYYRTLLQKVDEYPLGYTGPRTAFIPLIPPHQSPPSSLDSTLPGSRLLSQSLPRSGHHDHTLLFTPPWQQSLGLVTSSAEQEEGGSTQQSEGQTDSQSSLHHVAVWQRDCRQDRDGDTDQRLSSLPLSLYQNHSPASPIHHQADGNTPIRHTWSSPSQPGPSGTVPLSPGVTGFLQGEQDVEKNDDNYNNMSLLGSVVWEDMPFSESLAEFLCQENERFDRIAEMEPILITPHGRETTSVSLGNSSYTKKSSTETVASHSNIPPPDTHSHGRTLLDITNTAALSYGGDFTSNSGNQTCGDVDWNVSQTGDVRSSIKKREGDEEEEIRLRDGEGVYDCSADLFDSSLTTPDTNAGTHAQMADADVETQALIPDRDSPAEAHPTWTDEQTDATDTDLSESSSIQVQHSYLPDTPDVNSNEDTAMAQKERSHLRDTEGLTNSKKDATYTDQCEYSLCLDFIPSSQSTPLITRPAPVGLPVPTQRTCTLGELDSQPSFPHVSYHTWIRRGSDNPVDTASPYCKSNKLYIDSRRTEQTQASSTTPPGRRLTPKRGSKRTLWKLEQEPKQILASQQRMRLQKRRARSRGSTQRTDIQAGDRNLCDTSVCDNSVCNDTKDELMVPPTTDRTRRPVEPRQRLQTDDCAKDLTSTQFNCKRTLLYQTTPQRPQTSLVHCRQTGDVVCTQPGDGERTGSGPKMSGDGVSFALRDESGTCDWSRDLFSDSF